MLLTMHGDSLDLNVLAEAAGGLVRGIGGGLHPDWIDTPCSPRHRAEAHSMRITGKVGYYTWH